MIGDFIRQIRTSRNLTQAELAEVSGVGQPNVSAYEKGHRVPTADTLNRLVVSCGYELAAVAGERAVYCDLPKVGWFPDEDNPPRLPDDPPDEEPALPDGLSPTDRNRVVTALIDAFAP